MRGIRVTLLALPLLAWSLLHAQSAQRPQFRADVEMVEVDVTVVDRQGRVVAGLTQADFDVLEDGVAVEISTFDAVVLPDAPPPSWQAAVPDTSGGVRANNERALEGRIVVLFVDDRGFSFNAGRFQRLKRSVRAFLDRLGPTDQVALMSSTGARALQVEFTTDRQRIWRAFDVPPVGESNTGERTLEVLGRIAKQLEPVSRRRKLIAFFSEGNSLGIRRSMVVGAKDENMVPYLQEFLDSARRANVVLYSFDVRPPGSLDQMVDHKTLDDAVDGRATAADADSDLYTVAEATGGQAAVSTNLPAEAVGRMFEETRSYYLIGYMRRTAGDGKFHEIKVRTRTDGYVVRARAGFFDKKVKDVAAAPAALVDRVVGAPVQTHGLTLRTAAIPVPAAKGGGTVVMTEINSAQLVDVRTLDVTTMAVDMDGKVRATDRYSASMSMPPDGAARWARLASYFELPFGRYQLRVAAADRDGNIRGSVFAEFEVPKFHGGLAIGGLILGVPGTRGVARAERIPGYLGVAPVASADLTSDMNVQAVVPLRVAGSGEAIDIAWYLIAPDGAESELQRRSVPRSELPAGLGTSNVPLPLETAVPGTYRVGVAVSSGPRASVRRETTFRVTRARQ